MSYKNKREWLVKLDETIRDLRKVVNDYCEDIQTQILFEIQELDEAQIDKELGTD